MADERAAVTFYAEALGFTEVLDLKALASGFWCETKSSCTCGWPTAVSGT